MLTVLIKDNGEKNVVQFTYENLWRELKDSPDSELLVVDDWFDALDIVKNKFVCFVETDCLVSSGYFASQLGLFKKDDFSKKLAVLSSATAISQWHNKIYGYELRNSDYVKGFVPSRRMKSNKPYAVEVGYIPGSIMRVSMLRRLLDEQTMDEALKEDLVYLSVFLSLGFWSQSLGKNNGGRGTKPVVDRSESLGNRVHINPNATYVTTEESVNNIGQFDLETSELMNMFAKESI